MKSSISSRYTIVVVLAMWIIQCFVFKSTYQTKPFSWDVFGYYLYLPATLIEGDPALKNEQWLNDVYDQYQPSDTRYQLSQRPNSKVVKYSSGMAILYLPAFAMGHLWAHLSDHSPDGFSTPYQHCFNFWSLFVALFGIWMMSLVLRKLFSDAMSAWLLAILVIGTNYLFTAMVSIHMSHNYLFTLTALLLWCCIKYQEGGKRKHLFSIAVLIGLMALARPTEIVLVFLPLLWGIGTSSSLIAKAIKDKKGLALAIGTVAAIGSIQLIYWKIASGQWIYYSYDNPAEGLDFASPYLAEVLFSFRKGWLIYTPVMAFAILGLIPIIRSRFAGKWGLLVTLILHFYLFSCWTNWWYAESFSARPLVQAYPLWIIALGLGWQVVYSKKFVRYLTFAMAVAFIGLNLFQSWQVSQSILHPSRTTQAYYWEVFGKTAIPEGASDLLLIDRTPVDGKVPWPNKEQYTKEKIKDWGFSEDDPMHLNQVYDLVSRWPSDSIMKGHPTWLELEMTTCLDPELQKVPDIALTYMHGEKGHHYEQHEPVWEMTEAGVWTSSFVYLIPELQRPNDDFLFQLFHTEGSDFALCDLKLHRYCLPDSINPTSKYFNK